MLGCGRASIAGVVAGVLGLGAVLGPAAAPAAAGTYEVRVCDAAEDYSNRSWWGQVTHGGMANYASCPTRGLDMNGLVTRHAAQPAGWTVPTGAASMWIFNAPPGAVVVGLRASARFETQSHQWQVGLSNGSTLIAGCWAQAAPHGGCGSHMLIDQYVPVPASPTIYTETLCVHGPCPASYASGGPGNVYARAILHGAVVTVAESNQPALTNPRGDLWTDRWIRGTQGVAFDASDPTGIKALRVYVDGQWKAGDIRGCDPAGTACPDGGGTYAVSTVDGVTDGEHTLTLQAIDRADNVAALSRTVRIDNTAPAGPQGLDVAGGEGWRSTNRFELNWRNPPQAGTAPVAGAEFVLCPADGPSARCVRGGRDGAAIATIKDVAVPQAGDWTLKVWLRDAAGNADEKTAAPAVRLRVDATAPQVAIRPVDPSDPTRVNVKASDDMSGIARAELELSRVGTNRWRALPTTPSADGFSALLDDERLANGTYELRARAVDAAGNERSSDRLTSGDAARVTMPVRVATHMRVGVLRRARIARRGRYRYRRVLVTRPLVRRGRRVRLRGRLTAPGGNPLAGVQVDVVARPDLPGSPFAPVARLRTSRTGRFTYLLPAGPSRIVRLRYPGTPTIRAQTREIYVRVRAGSTIRPNRRSLLNGEAVVLSGRLLGGPVPAHGKLIEMQALVDKRWKTFDSARADASGRWSYTYHFRNTFQRAKFRFRVRIPREAGYPYAPGVSRRTRVTVTGI